MLFDLRAGGRRRLVQVVYLFLAILLGGGLVLFGVGGATSGGLFDAFRENSSGDIFVAFSTANARAASDTGVAHLTMIPNGRINPLFYATTQATEEAILNALCAARTMVGIDDHKAIELPHDRVQEILRRHGRLQEPAK